MEILAVLFLTLMVIPYWSKNREIRKIMKGEKVND